MAFQQGVSNIADAANTHTVVFATEFESTPDVVIAVVQNTVDAAPILIDAFVVSTTSADFEVELSQTTDSANYQLVWVAGGAAIVYEIIAQLGFKVSDLTLHNSVPEDDDYFPFVKSSPLPVTKRVKWETIASAFTKYVADAPASPAANGDAGDWSVDATYVYTHDGISWGRTKRHTVSWDVELPEPYEQRGQASISAAATSVVVVFDQEFGGVPEVVFSFENTAGGSPALLTGLLTSVASTGFTVTLNAATVGADYKLNWSASSTDMLP